MPTMEERVKKAMATAMTASINFQNKKGREPPMSFFAIKAKENEEGDELGYLNINDIPKRLAEALIATITRDTRPEFAMLVCGAWMARTQTKEETDQLMERYGAVKDVPGREDVLIVSARTMHGINYMATVVVKDGKADPDAVVWEGFGEAKKNRAGEGGAYDRFLDRVVFRTLDA